VILDLPRFIAVERPFWDELETTLTRRETEPERRLSLVEVQRLHYLYERTSGALVRLDTFSAEPKLRAFLESLAARAYTEIHETRAPIKFRWRAALFAFPRAFRRHVAAFHMSLGVTLLGCAFGWFAIRADPHVKAVLTPFQGLNETPAERVAKEESADRTKNDRLRGQKASFSAQLMTHNIQVTTLTMACGMTWGVGTLILLFYNGVILGAVAADYIGAGYTAFLIGWLLPHGSIEIPSILLGGQAGFILAGALIGWGGRTPRRERLRAIAPDLLAIIGGAAVMLVWAGLVEAFISQYHRPVLPYGMKIGFGVCELIALTAFLGWGGRE
jgi:uncharacterized membrane protein SpoIIM required for sporulation